MTTITAKLGKNEQNIPILDIEEVVKKTARMTEVQIDAEIDKLTRQLQGAEKEYAYMADIALPALRNQIATRVELKKAFSPRAEIAEGVTNAINPIG